MSDEQKTPDVRIENHAAHVKHIAVVGGQVITVPPTEEGRPGVGVTFANDDERKGFEAALAQPVIKAWIDKGELIVQRGSSAPATPPATPPADPVAAKGGKGRSDRE